MPRKRSASSSAYENFIYSYNRLDALYMQVFEEPINFTPKMRELVAEMLITQLVAAAEAYELELTELLIGRGVLSIAKTKAARTAVIRLLSSGPSMNWQEVYEQIIDTATRSVTDHHSFDQWLAQWLPNNNIPIKKVDASDRALLEEILATRNLLVHHRGIVNSAYLHRSRAYYAQESVSPPSLNTPRNIDKAYCLASMRCIQTIIVEVDTQAVGRL